MNAPQMRRRAHELLTEAQTILDASSRGTVTPGQEARVSGLIDEAERLRGEADAAERREGFTGVTKPGGYGPMIIPNRTADNANAIFCRYLRTGDQGAENELRDYDARAYNDTTINVTTDADGGVAVPVGMVGSIMARRDEMMLAPKLGCVVVPGVGTTVNWPIDDEADIVFAAVGESAAIDQDAPALTEKAFTLVKYAKYLTLTWEILRDNDARLEQFVSGWLARGWAGTHNSLLVTEVLANGTAALTLDSATAIGASEVPELVGKLLPEYQQGAQWLMGPGTYSHLSGLTGNPFNFAPTPGSNQGRDLWGYPLNQTSYMPAIQASAKSMVFGNFEFVGYRDGSLSILRDPYSDATNGHVRLHAWFSAVYGVLQAEALAYSTHPTA